jgi:hypothetical protein
MTTMSRRPRARLAHRAARGRRGGILIVGFQLALLLGACAVGPGAPAPGSAPAPSTAPSASPPSPGGVTVPPAVLDPLIDDVVTRTGAVKDSITVVEATAATWPTGALGCPTPGVMYTQAVVTGWQVILASGATRIDYRASGPGRFRVCG